MMVVEKVYVTILRVVGISQCFIALISVVEEHLYFGKFCFVGNLDEGQR